MDALNLFNYIPLNDVDFAFVVRFQAAVVTIKLRYLLRNFKFKKFVKCSETISAANECI